MNRRCYGDLFFNIVHFRERCSCIVPATTRVREMNLKRNAKIRVTCIAVTASASATHKTLSSRNHPGPQTQFQLSVKILKCGRHELALLGRSATDEAAAQLHMAAPNEWQA